MAGPVTGLFAPPADAIAGPPQWRNAEQHWLLTRYADVQKVLRAPDVEVVEFHPRIEAIGRRAGRDYGSLVRLLAGVPLFRNPPWHGTARDWLRRSLAEIGPRLAEAEIARVIDAAVAPLVGAGFIDAVPRLGSRIPILVMAQALGLSEQTVEALHRDGRGVVDAWQPGLPLRVYDRLQQQAAAIEDALRREIGLARTQGGPLHAFLALNDAGPNLGDGEVAGCLFGLIMAGIETTSGLLASVLHAAFADPSHARGLRAGTLPEREFVEEVLRLAPPLRRPSTRRLARAQRLGDTDIEDGSLVVLDLLAAHRDPTAFERPDVLDPHRSGAPILAFGAGLHACLGGHLATLEARLLLRAVLRLDASLRQGEDPDWDPDPTFRRLRRLDLKLDRFQPGAAEHHGK